MPSMPKTLFWSRTDVPGADHTLVTDHRGLTARGTAVAVDPIAFTCRYALRTDEHWATEGLEVSCEGAGWLRTLRLERAAGRWRASTAEQGDLDAALAAAGQPGAGLPGTEEPERLAEAVDVDLSASPLFNTLPVRRLRLREAAPGSSHRVVAVWVLVPSLQVVPAEQTYTVLEGGNVRFTSESFTADLTLDADGYVLHYPGLAHRH
ncbi:putative glycolipid-binding domain-containing protein [Plantactinospora sp. KLBMP9567]|uniref:putative glycolipid-binding domain-containing protein n=1 Tax=Plantactinospora sp. KLBMP9567 TaxID=3085900 RepID=UPI002981A25E|nr:putative glycolipid-binding domain-containing protein [Plantactinospora sp. KLBMP9567]MDW5329106.1 putative glycolipid-binding domain-containing protein [Plantactinospora sp. KLBMP9567]MDW5329990.1 putative glycolipid-binding domain-containing protein [Plantactinospora sp. KLBMP9567]